MDNAPVHLPDIKLKNISFKFFPSNTTSRIQPLGRGAIKTLKPYYRKQLVQHIITNAKTSYPADDVALTALDAVCWISNAWKPGTELTINNTFKEAGFHASIHADSTEATCNNDDVVLENKCLDELHTMLTHLTIAGGIMSANDFIVSVYSLL